MRNNLKTQCLDTIDLLTEAHEEVYNLIEKNQTADAVDLLGQCQQGAISIGNLIEKSEGEDTDEVHMLEEYCEFIWHICEDVNNGGSVNIRKVDKKLRKLLINIANGIKNNIPTQREVLFLPYKASMWDSLEPVWRKMEADPDVTAIVMPVPYYDRLPDGRFTQIHYEGTQFPKDVPIVGYQNYNIEERHPDAIYIHNPYDDANYVTSVHPDYYSSRLKDLTDELVYIPYFILGDIDPDNKEALKGVEHFITVPAVMNAHKVIVQSENWRKAYINVMTKFAGENTRGYWADKIDGSGSPKVERVKNLTAEDYILPKSWESIVNKPDGSRKKIIFYNTSVGALLQENEKMIDKIERVLDTFKENADDVTLLWRPHPLMEATLSSLRPSLLMKYRTLVDEYKADGWGIYDDSAELDRAIAVSDAYYGDWSSAVWLYQQTKKPIMIQNCEV